MTEYDRKKLDKALDTFESFMDFHKFSYKHNIVFDNKEWQEYRNKLLKQFNETSSETIIEIDTSGIIMPF